VYIFFLLGIDRTIKCWRLEENDNLVTKTDHSFNDLKAEESTVENTSEEGNQIETVAEKLENEKTEINKKKKKKKKNKRFVGNNYRMQFNLCWDEDHREKINVISGFRIDDNEENLSKLFVADVTSDLAIYNIE
jgi:hypothetical protein